MTLKHVISASRRTDIPAFYMPWFMAAIDKGHFEVVNPYNRRTQIVPAGPDQVHTLVFWSKNFAPFLTNGYGRLLERRGYHLFFNFTINSPHPILEPHVPPLNKRLDQLSLLCEQHGPACIQWRFDPICYFINPVGQPASNLDQFETIAKHAASLGIDRCITSFVDIYQKVKRRIKRTPGPLISDPPMKTKTKQISKMAADLNARGIQLCLCCEKEILDALPDPDLVQSAACIPNKRLAALYGPEITLSRDRGQRRSAGCQCGASKDIGSYSLHPCHHNCLFCYANPSGDLLS